MVKDLANRQDNAIRNIIELGQIEQKRRVLNCIIPKELAKLHVLCAYHIHDLEFYDLTYNCIGLTLKNLIGKCRHSLGLSETMRVLFRRIVELSNAQSGGIGIINFDSDIAEYISHETDEEIIVMFREFLLDLNISSRKGCEKPYLTLNFGLDTLANAKRASLLLLRAYELGDEEHRPFIFPNLVFKLQKGINVGSNDQNYDVFQKALSVTAKRMMPTYMYCDSSINAVYDASQLGVMGCRSRIALNLHGDCGSIKRGNIASVTINLPQIAYIAKYKESDFYNRLTNMMQKAVELLLHRFSTLCGSADLSVLFNNEYYLSSETHNAEQMLRNGTLALGFIGLWETVSMLYGFDYKNTNSILANVDKAYNIVQHMRNYIDDASKNYHMNFSLLASSAEGTTGRFAKYDVQHYGINTAIKGFYTNSFHIPVDANITLWEKLEIEGRFHKLCNGGSISYIEFSEMPLKNIEAIKMVVDYAMKCDCNYFGINFPLDSCRECLACGCLPYYCPNCGSDDILRLRRVSGYLSEVDKFTEGKKLELLSRVPIGLSNL